MLSFEEKTKLQEIKKYIMSTDSILLNKKNIDYPQYDDIIDKLINIKEIKEDVLDLIKQYRRINSTLPVFLQEDPEYLVTGVEDGWVHVDNKTWQRYLRCKEMLDDDLK